MLHGNSSRLGESPRIPQLIEKSAGRRFEAFDVIGGHLRPPVPQTGRSWPVNLNTAGVLEGFMIVEHSLVICQA
jgi:hypothetical protein